MRETVTVQLFKNKIFISGSCPILVLPMIMGILCRTDAKMMF
jgi:hypothetical protein